MFFSSKSIVSMYKILHAFHFFLTFPIMLSVMGSSHVQELLMT